MTWPSEIVQRWIGKDLEHGDVARLVRVIRELVKYIKLIAKKYDDALAAQLVFDAELVEAFDNLSPDAREVIDELAE